MKKAELEQKLIELEKKIAVLEARPVCFGHYCNCNHVCTLPHYPNYPTTTPNYPTTTPNYPTTTPNYPTTTPYWPNNTPWYPDPGYTSCGGTATGGLTDKNAETATFGKINS